MGKKICVMGAGGIGGNLAGHLALSGQDVTIVDHWAAHVEAIKTAGLKISDAGRAYVVHPRALHVGEAWAVGEIDILILGVKAYDNDWAVALLKPYLQPDAIVISAQNGVQEERLAELVGYGRVIGAVVALAGETLEPGHVKLSTPQGRLIIGELHGRITPRLEALSDLFQNAIQAPMTTNVWGELWSKLILNTMSNPINGVLNGKSKDVKVKPGPRRVSLQAAAEAARVGLALGYDIPPISLGNIEVERFVKAAQGEGYEELDREVEATGPLLGDFYGSMPLDMRRGRKTEVDSFSGYVVAKGREIGIPTPVNQAVYRLVLEIEAGRLQSGPEHLQTLLAACDDVSAGR